MKFARSIGSHATASAALALMILSAATAVAADGASSNGVVFQRPRQGGAAATSSAGVQFRSSAPAPVPATNTSTETAANPLRQTVDAAIAPAVASAPAIPPAAVARPISEAPRPAANPEPRTAARPVFAQPGDDLSGAAQARRARAIRTASVEPWVEAQQGGVEQAGYCDCGEPTCGICEPACGLAEPGCGIMEPECGLVDACCGPMEDDCPILGGEPACGCAEPDCGIVGCGSCVGNPGPDYWCFPVCLPRIKELRVWAGVHGFKGPRDAPLFGGAGDGNFGFQEGVNIGGRAPLVSLLFPQLSYQLGIQGVQSQLHGLSDGTTSDRSQTFVTGGVFRRVRTGLQFGVVWDSLRDDFQTEEDWNQLRYEISMKGAAGREFGFMGASSLSDATVAGVTYESVEQYCGFFRLHFRDGGAIRFWGGGTNDSEGIFGGDFVAPLNNRWSIQTGFNYLIPDIADGSAGAREESWNVGINLMWHFGRNAKAGQLNPHAPLFFTADNGSFFIDEAP